MTKTPIQKMNKRNKIQQAIEEDAMIQKAIEDALLETVVAEAIAENEFGLFNQDIQLSNKNKLREKIGEKSIQRSSKENKELILGKMLQEIDIDKDKLKADLEALKKQGGLELNIKN